MSMTLAAVVLAAETAEKASEHGAENVLPASPTVFGIVALITFAFLLLVTWSFRSLGTRHD